MRFIFIGALSVFLGLFMLIEGAKTRHLRTQLDQEGVVVEGVVASGEEGEFLRMEGEAAPRNLLVEYPAGEESRLLLIEFAIPEGVDPIPHRGELISVTYLPDSPRCAAIFETGYSRELQDAPLVAGALVVSQGTFQWADREGRTFLAAGC